MLDIYNKNNLLKNLLLTLPVVVAGIVFAGIFKNGFVWDDVIAFELEGRYRDIGYLYNVFFEPLIFSKNYYRPVVSASFILQNHFFGVEASGLHLVSLLLHLVNTLLVTINVFLLTRKWGAQETSRYYAITAGLLYGTHASLVEPVAFISARFDLLMTLFVLLMILVSLTVNRIPLRSVLIGALFLLAALSKEMVLGFALALPIWLLVIQENLPTRPAEMLRRLYRPENLWVLVAAFVAGVIYLLMRTHAIGGFVVTENPLKNSPFGIKLMFVIRSLFEYLAMEIAPIGNISPAHPVQSPFNMSDSRNILALIAIPAAGILSLWLLRKNTRLLLFLAMAVLSLVPVLGFFPLSRPIDLYFSETYLPMPTVFLSLLVVSAVYEAFSRNLLSQAGKKLVYAGAAIWLLLNMFTVVTTVPLWKNDLVLWSWVSEQKPGLVIPRIDKAIALSKHGRHREALDILERITRDHPDNVFGWAEAGKIHAQLGHKKEALDNLYTAVRIDPADTEYWLILASALAGFNELAPAKEILLHEALTRNPNDWQANAQIGFIYAKQKQNRLARDHLQQALRFSPPERYRVLIEKTLGELDR